MATAAVFEANCFMTGLHRLTCLQPCKAEARMESKPSFLVTAYGNPAKIWLIMACGDGFEAGQRAAIVSKTSPLSHLGAPDRRRHLRQPPRHGRGHWRLRRAGFRSACRPGRARPRPPRYAGPGS